MDHTRKRLDELRWVCMEHKNPQISRDLMKLWRNTEALFTECDRQAVTVRRLQRNTVQYQEAQERFYASLANLEKRITWANLL